MKDENVSISVRHKQVQIIFYKSMDLLISNMLINSKMHDYIGARWLLFKRYKIISTFRNFDLIQDIILIFLLLCGRMAY